MKKTILFIVMLVGAISFTNAQVTTPNPAPTTKITFDKLEHDYGTLMQDPESGPSGDCVFKFTNTGTQPLIITSATGSCGCTVPNQSVVNKPFAPGESGELKVHYDVKRIGPFTKNVTIKSNGSAEDIKLTIKGKIEPLPADEGVPVNKAVEGATPTNN